MLGRVVGGRRCCGCRRGGRCGWGRRCGCRSGRRGRDCVGLRCDGGLTRDPNGQAVIFGEVPSDFQFAEIVLAQEFRPLAVLLDRIEIAFVHIWRGFRSLSPAAQGGVVLMLLIVTAGVGYLAYETIWAG